MILFNHYYCMTHLAHTELYDTYLAYSDVDPQHQVVLKVFDAQCMLPTATAEVFQRQEKRLQHLQHPHIVAMLALGQGQGTPYLVSEYQPGISVRQHMDRLSSGHLSLDNAMTIVTQIGQAVAFAHAQGIVHLDIQPENILLDDQGHAHLTNFHLSDIIQVPGLKNLTDYRTINYRSPEQAIGIGGPASDQYALGCLLYELITGNFPNPVSAQQPSAPESTLPDALKKVILRTLALKPEDRYPDVTTFLDELQRVTQPKPATIFATTEADTASTLHQALTAHAHLTSLDVFSHYEPTEDMAEIVPPEPSVAEPDTIKDPLPDVPPAKLENPELLAVAAVKQQEKLKKDLSPPPPHRTFRSTLIMVQGNIIRQASSVWKRPAGLIATAAALFAIALFLAFSFNPKISSEVQHAALLATATTTNHQPTATATLTTIPVITQPTAAQSVPTLKPTPPKQTPVVGPTPPKPTHPQPTPTPTTRQLGVGSIQIDSGGSGAGPFVGDTDFSNTLPNRPSSSSNDTSNSIDTSAVSNPAPQSVYQSARIGDCLYTISHLTPNASYAVRLHFAEMYWTQAGKRTFNVTLNGNLVLANFDIFATAGGAEKAVVERFVVPADKTGTITIQFQTVKNNAQINGIEVLAV